MGRWVGWSVCGGPIQIHTSPKPNGQNWAGTLISEILLAGGSLCLFAIFVLIIIYWADLLKKVRFCCVSGVFEALALWSSDGVWFDFLVVGIVTYAILLLTLHVSTTRLCTHNARLLAGVQARAEAGAHDELPHHHGLPRRLRGA